jgi:hypothetical protein
MSTSSTAVTLASDVVAKARLFAENRHCSLDELADEALRSFIGMQPAPSPEVQKHLDRAMQLGLTVDEYAVRMVKEVRAELRAEGRSESAS